MAEGLDKVFTDAGAEWREAGCSMCLGMNPDQLAPGERSASTSNRNFEGRQGKGGRTHLVSPPVAAATAVRGTLPLPGRPVRKQPWTSSPPTPASPSRCGAATSTPTRSSPRSTSSGSPAPASRTGCSPPGATTPTFVLNQPAYAAGSILVAGPDFGTGSSREHAVWALQNYGFKVVIGSRFGDIFRGNSGKAGLLVADRRPGRRREAVGRSPRASPGIEFTVDLQPPHDRGRRTTCFAFTIDDYTRHRLLEGLDDIGLTLQHADEIAAYEATRPSWLPRTLPVKTAG